MQTTRAAWIEVNLDKLVSNINKIKANISDKSFIISVVKYNAYSLGASEVVRTLLDQGIDFFAVATMTEALALRKDFPNIKILILGHCELENYKEAIEKGIRLTIFNLEEARYLNNLAKSLKKKANIHIALDTGMGRIGFFCNEDSVLEIEKINNLENVNIEGIFSHFAVADTDPEYTKMQFNNFMKVIKALEEKNINIKIKHISNSQAILHYKEYNLDAVRPGIIQYGSDEGYPSEFEDFKLDFVAELKAKISHIKTINPGDKISYGLIFTAKEKMKIATLPIGYADGILRQLSGKLDILVNGKRCKQIGNICMDQMMIDVTGVDCKIDDEVVIFGKQGEEYIDIAEIAEIADEIVTSYICHLSYRLPRIYIKNNKKYKIIDPVLNIEKEF
ncbi:alanine racemase [Peptoniphilus obesi]|uniref:alanine racemase n=1 Tax=Peptoniphilus obesi TaxID=1472765 RepID=UPI0004B64B4B|nr:alanine racemase [Peptoniphilus obesi]